MSSEAPDLSLDGLTAQLRRYGRWLEDRSDVALGPLDLDGEASTDPKGGPPRRPRTLAAVAAGVAGLALVVVGIGVVADRDGATDRVATAPADEIDGSASDTPTSDGDGGRLVPEPGTGGRESSIGGPIGAASAGGAPGSDDAAAGTDTAVDAATAEPVAGEEPAEPPPAPAGDGDDPDQIPDSVLMPSTSVLPDSSEASWPAGEGEVEGGGAGRLIASPVNGATLDLNVTNTIVANPVAGATTYSFEGWQDGQQVLATSGANPRLILPSQMLTSGPWAMRPGQLTIRVTATDAAGATLASGEVQVTVEGSSASYPFPTSTPSTTAG